MSAPRPRNPNPFPWSLAPRRLNTKSLPVQNELDARSYIYIVGFGDDSYKKPSKSFPAAHRKKTAMSETMTQTIVKQEDKMTDGVL